MLKIYEICLIQKHPNTPSLPFHIPAERCEAEQESVCFVFLSECFASLVVAAS